MPESPVQFLDDIAEQRQPFDLRRSRRGYSLGARPSSTQVLEREAGQDFLDLCHDLVVVALVVELRREDLDVELELRDAIDNHTEGRYPNLRMEVDETVDPTRFFVLESIQNNRIAVFQRDVARIRADADSVLSLLK